MNGGRCFRAVDSVSDEEPKLIAIDEEANHQIVHGDRFRKANGATYKPFNPGSQIDVFAFDFRSYWIPGSWNLRMVYTDDILFPDP